MVIQVIHLIVVLSMRLPLTGLGRWVLRALGFSSEG